MCGIIGRIHHSQPAALDLFQGQCETLRHRGPDDSGLWLSPDGRIALGNRRLAIQDLSAAGHMPMSDPSGRVWVTFNGEIYNFLGLRKDLEQRGHTFRSSSDTEVVLAAYLEWGTECLAHLNGMFAFAIYDDRSQRAASAPLPAAIARSVAGPCLFMARDRAGEKPLYYWQHAQGVSFASELKALIADPALPRRLHLPALNAFLALGYVPGEMCILEGVRKLPPAHALIYDMQKGSLRTWQYWSLPKAYQGEQTRDDEGLVEELADLLQESVRLRLIADVPVGILLSGGIDSSLVTAMAARSSPQPVRTFTITFPGHGIYDEGPYARQVAEYFGTNHHELVAEPATMDLLPQLARNYDEPLADSSLVPTYLVSRLTRQYVTVALSGDGGDELFGGYLHYSSGLRMRRWLAYAPRPVRAVMAQSAQRWLPIGFKGRNFLSSLGGDLGERIVTAGALFDMKARQLLLTKPVREMLHNQFSLPEDYKCQIWRQETGPVEQMTRLDFLTHLPDDILVKVDRASMAVSLEVRAPWLDQRIIEFAFGRVPAHLKATANTRKVLLRRLAQRLLPAHLDLSRKQGFSLPLASWFRADWGKFCADVLRQSDRQLFEPKLIDELLTGQHRGFSNTARIFALVMFELWRRQYKVRPL